MVCELYLAKNIASLDKIALESGIVRKLKDKKHSMYKSADTCWRNIDSDLSDEERTYILIKRFLCITDSLFLIEDDKKYFDLMLGKPIEKYKCLLNVLRRSLEQRYADLSVPENLTDDLHPVEVMSPPKKQKFFGTDAFVSCKEFYEAFITDSNLMLVMDTRSKDDYNESHLKGFNVINISEECVTPGLSAHVLGSKLAVDVQEVYEQRDNFEYIILMDWDSTPNTFISTKLHTLRDILIMWDINKNYKNPPFVLNGGYVEFIDMYPTLSTNSHVVYSHKYLELDELLDLDGIQYPSEDTAATYYVLSKNEKLCSNDDDLMDEMVNVSSKLLRIEQELLNNQLKIFDLEMKMSVEDSQQNLIENKEILNKELSKLETSKIMYDERKSILAKEIDGVQARMGNRLSWTTKKAQVDTIDAEICDAAFKRKQVNDERDLYFDGENALQQKKRMDEIKGIASAGDSPEAVNRRTKSTPVINRNTKPIRPLHYIQDAESSSGLTGIVNIRNTCYMNAVIQCMRHVPIIKDFFCKGAYINHVIKKPPVILFEMAQLIKSLWAGSVPHVRPSEFYSKIGTINPVFQEGHHEDCTEFFMLLINSLSDDCATDVGPLQKYKLAKHEAWLYRLGNKTSFFIDMFYHQIRLSCVCYVCEKKCQKFELESTFMLSVPDNPDFKLETLMERYLSSQDMVTYCCSKCDVDIKQMKEVSYQPKVAVIVLKRYKFDKGVLQKKKNACIFPTNNFKIGRGTYKLWAIAMHLGSMQAGHYTAACLNPYDENWYEFNDETVSRVAIDGQEVKQKVYMLFYELVHSSDKEFGFDNL